VLSEEFRPTESRAGTPAYMAPEQLARNEVSVQSDLWSLGAVLYEMFTGHRALHGNTMLEVRRELESAAVANPSTMLGGLDPVVERAILRCLEREPGARPASALAVAASLPGGDPLSAALAAGEMPSPEVVAAAGGAGALRPRVAWVLLAGILAGLSALLPLADRVLLMRRVPLDKPPAVLVDRAREVLRDLGYVNPPVDEAHGLGYFRDYLRWVRDHDKSAGRWRDLEDGRPAAIRFWYRESPQHMYQTDFRDGLEVTYYDPPLVLSGMAAVLLDPQGRLLQLEAVPPQLDSVRAAAPPADWSLLFDRAGIDPATLAPAAPEWTPPVYCDQRAAWLGPDPETPGRRLRVEAGAYRGRPNYFQIVGPWTRPARMLPRDETRSERLGQAVSIAVVVTLLVGSVLLARRNVRRGHGDTRGAWKLAVFVFASSGIAWMVVANHSTNAAEEWQSTLQFLGLFTFLGAVYWVLYVALEPAVRRRWPDSLIGWNRLLAGRFRDPGVGRDVLVGVLAGSAMALLEAARIVLVGALGAPPPMPVTVGLDPLLGFAPAAATFLTAPVDAVFTPMALVFILILLRMLLRRPRLSVAVLVVISLPILGAGAESPIFSLPILVASFAILLVTLLRYGLLAAITCSFVTTLLERFPGTSDFSVWYAPVTAFVGLVLLAVALYAFRTAVGDQPLFGRKLLVE
jgi:serine/threonine-protein kinase